MAGVAEVAAAIDAVLARVNDRRRPGARGPGARAERRGAAGVILLDRPQALNALTLPMVRIIAAALDGSSATLVARVVVASAGGRAFCAGGDIRWIYERGQAGDHAAQLDFWREEYQLNRRIKRYSKPDRRADRRHRHGRRRRPLAPMAPTASPARAPYSPCPKSASASFPMSARPMSCRACATASASISRRPACARSRRRVALGLAQTFTPSDASPSWPPRSRKAARPRRSRAFRRAAAAPPARGAGPAIETGSPARAPAGSSRRLPWPPRVARRSPRARSGDARQVADQSGDGAAIDRARGSAVVRGGDAPRISHCLAHLSRSRSL